MVGKGGGKEEEMGVGVGMEVLVGGCVCEGGGRGEGVGVGLGIGVNGAGRGNYTAPPFFPVLVTTRDHIFGRSTKTNVPMSHRAIIITQTQRMTASTCARLTAEPPERRASPVADPLP